MAIEISELHFSALKTIAQSPMHFRSYLERGRADTASMRLGRAVHTMCLGGPEFAVFDGRRDGKKWDEFKAANADREILSVSEHATARGIADSVRSHPRASELIREAHETEAAMRWERDGFQCAGRVDAYRAGSWVLDLKTTRDARPDRFKWEVQRLGYAEQLAWYADGLQRNARTCPEAYLIVVESAPPHPVVVYRLTARKLDYARRNVCAWLEQLRVCLAADHWPGYTETDVDLDADDGGPEDGEDWTDEEEAA
jgi:hypothetical protein